MPDLRRFLAACGMPRRDQRNQRLILIWWLGWMLSWLGVLWAVKRGLLDGGVAATAAAIASSLLALGGIAAYRRYLREADELRRKIELDALAAAFAVGAVGGLVYWLFAEIGTVTEAGLPEMAMAMIATHSLGVMVGHWRYS